VCCVLLWYCVVCRVLCVVCRVLCVMCCVSCVVCRVLCVVCGVCGVVLVKKLSCIGNNLPPHPPSSTYRKVDRCAICKVCT
jgi:hypothetical protein